jgi:hypothetical protein
VRRLELDRVSVAIGPALAPVRVVQAWEPVQDLARVLPVPEPVPELARVLPASEHGPELVQALPVSELGQASARQALEHDRASVPVLLVSEHGRVLVSVLQALEHGRARCPDWAQAYREWEIVRGNCPRIVATIFSLGSRKDRGTFKIAVRTGPTIVAKTGKISPTTITGTTATGITAVGTATGAGGGTIYGTIIPSPPQSV